MTEYEVSVIVPVYNAEKYLSETLEALKNQSFTNMEVVLVDDGSTDNSSSIVDDFCLIDKRFKAIHISNSGVYNARLIGIQQASGEYIAFCDSDDIPLPKMMEKMYQCIVDTKADMVVCGFAREDMETGHILSKEMISFDNRVYNLEEEGYILPVINSSNWNKMIKKDILSHAFQFEKPSRILEDLMFLCSLYPYIKNVAFLPEVLYRYRVHSGGAMTYVKENEIKLIQQNYVRVYEYAKEKISNDDMLLAYDSIALVHFGFSITLRQVQGGMKKKEAIKEAKEYLEVFFPQHRKAGYTLSWNLSHQRLLMKILIVRRIFCTKCLMIPFLSAYMFITNKMGIDIKW